MQLQNTNFTLKLDPKEIPFTKYEKDFTFIVNGKEYQTSRLVADILSPRIRQLHFIDETINSFNITIQDKNDEFDFSDIFSLISFEQQIIDTKKLQFFSQVFLELGNKQAYLDLFPKNTNKTTITNVFDLIQNKEICFHSFNNSNKPELKIEYEMIKPEIDFIARHFFEIDQEKVKTLDLSIIESICKNDKLRLKDEDSFLQFIIGLYLENQKASYLFEYVDFINISDEEIEQFRQSFNLNDITGSIWNMVIDRSLKINRNSTYIRNKKRYDSLHFDHDKTNEFNGIVKYLTNKAGGNIHDKGLIEVSTNSQNLGRPPKNLLDFNNDNYYEANKNNDVFVLFDFKKMKVNLTKYSIRSYHSGVNECHLKNWKIEVSDDKKEWIVVDQHSDCPTLNGNRLIGTFDVKQKSFARFVRLYQTGNLWGNGHIWLHDIEFYGYLKDSE